MHHPLKEDHGSNNWRTLPEICMVLHMEFTGSSDFLSHEQIDEAVTYVQRQIDQWEPRRNGEQAAMFDAQVFGLCLAVLDEARRHRERFGRPEAT